MENLLIMNQVSLSFNTGFSLKDLSFEVHAGEIFGFLGPSGAGKTTTIKLLTKQLRKKSGSIQVLGKDISEMTRKDYDQIGIMSDTNGLYERRTIEQNLRFFAELRGTPMDAVDTILKKMLLYENRKTSIKKCSRGMKQRTILATAIMHHPAILFLDEPTSGLDPATTQEIHKLLLQLREEGTTIFLTTHNMEEADKLCDRIAILDQGKIIVCGDPDELKLTFARDEIKILKKDRSTLTVPKTEEGLKEALPLLASGECLTIHSQEPNLEEIFLQLTGKEF